VYFILITIQTARRKGRMRRNMVNRTAMLCAFLLGLCSAAAFAADNAQPAAPAQAAITVEKPQRFDIKDIFGRIIKADDLKGWIIIYGFGNEDNAEQAVEWLKQLTVSFPDTQGIMYVLVADASRYNKVFQPIVKKILKKEYSKNIEDLKARFVAKNIPITYSLEDRYILVIDTKGELLDLFGIAPDDRKTPHAIIVDGDHRVRAHFTQNTPELTAALGKVIEERKAQQAYAAVKMAHRKKKMWTRYALLGGLLYFVLK